MEGSILRRTIVIVAFIVACTWLGLVTLQPKVNAGDIKENVLTVDILNTGKSDCIIVKLDDFCMVIDTAYEKEQDKVKSYFEDNGITQIDYLILTHMDGDHIGNILYFLENYEIGNIIEPDYTKDTNLYKEYIKYRQENNIYIRHLSEDLTLNVGDLHISILIPKEKEYERSNDYSIVVLLEYGEHSFLLTADAEKKRLKELLEYNLKEYTVVKTPHHGQHTVELSEIIGITKPYFAVFTCISKEWVQQNFQKTLNAYKGVGTKCIYNTEGDIYFKTDGKTLWADQ